MGITPALINSRIEKSPPHSNARPINTGIKYDNEFFLRFLCFMFVN